MLLLLALIVLTDCASNNECKENQHTTAYLSCKNDQRPLSSLFIKESFINYDPCYPIDNNGYRSILSSLNIDQPNGFDVEHIIDLSNSIEGYLYIVGNLILSNYSWNRGIGNFCWENGKIEKREVYGDIFDQAYQNVLICSKKGTSMDINPAGYLLVICFFGFVICILLFSQIRSLNNEHSDQNSDNIWRENWK